MFPAFILFCIAFFISIALNLCIIALSKRFHLFIDSDLSDKPQRFHTLPTPRAGGIGIFVPFVLMAVFFLDNDWFELLSFIGIGGSLDGISDWENYVTISDFLLGLVLGGGIIFASGIIEDFHASLSPKFRLILQCLGAGVFVGISQNYLSDLGLGITLPSYIGIPFSIFAIVGMINALNIIDGFNGLASGVALLAFACISSVLPTSLISFVILILIASTLGFFVLNFPRGKIFLGDGGAYFLGFVLAGILIHITQTPITENGIQEISPWFGITLLIYPFWEVIFSIYRRKHSSFIADNLHFHQLLYHKLNSNPLTSLYILLFLSPFMILSTFFIGNQWVLLLLSIVFIISYLWIYRYLIGLTLKRK